MNALDIQDLSYSFGSHRALEGISFSVPAGCVHGFVGPNGAGKTTTLKIAATLLKPESGSVQIFGEDVASHIHSVRRAIGYMPDRFNMYRRMTVFEYLDFFAAAHGLGRTDRDRVVNDVLAITDMDGRRDALVGTLSRGMCQRVSLARVLVHDPRLLLLDEPASGLDPRSRSELLDILCELRKLGKTIFISSHILSELASLCDSVTVLDRGAVRYSGSMVELLRSQSEDREYRLELATRCPSLTEQLELIPGVTAVENGGCELRIRCDGRLESPNRLLHAALASGAEVRAFAEAARQLDDAFLALTTPGVRSPD
jgi:ABC-2 type transport system ATP-binding protein